MPSGTISARCCVRDPTVASRRSARDRLLPLAGRRPGCRVFRQLRRPAKHSRGKSNLLEAACYAPGCECGLGAHLAATTRSLAPDLQPHPRVGRARANVCARLAFLAARCAVWSLLPLDVGSLLTAVCRGKAASPGRPPTAMPVSCERITDCGQLAVLCVLMQPARLAGCAGKLLPKGPPCVPAGLA